MESIPTPRHRRDGSGPRPEGRRPRARQPGGASRQTRAGQGVTHAPGAPRSAVPPDELLRRLQIKVLRRLDGYLFGDVTGVFYGPSLDLAEVREYQPGDEVRRIDWYVTARTGVLHVRQYREEREIRGWLIVDRSPSMDFGTRRSLKSGVALEFAAAAASVLTRQGNKVGALAFGPSGTRLVQPSSGRMQVLRVLDALSSAPEEGRRGGMASDALTSSLERAGRTLRRRSLVFLVSDFLWDPGGLPPGESGPPWSRELRRLAARHDVIAVRVSDPAEHALPDVGDLRVRDPETGREIWIDTGDRRVREAHARLVEARERTLRTALRSSGADVLELSTAHDIVRPLVAFIRRRRARRLGEARP